MSDQQKVAHDFAMSEFPLILVLQKKQENPTIDMAKIQIKSERLTPFGGIFSGHGAIWLHRQVQLASANWTCLNKKRKLYARKKQNVRLLNHQKYWLPLSVYYALHDSEVR